MVAQEQSTAYRLQDAIISTIETGIKVKYIFPVRHGGRQEVPVPSFSIQARNRDICPTEILCRKAVFSNLSFEET